MIINVMKQGSPLEEDSAFFILNHGIHGKSKRVLPRKIRNKQIGRINHRLH